MYADSEEGYEQDLVVDFIKERVGWTERFDLFNCVGLIWVDDRQEKR